MIDGPKTPTVAPRFRTAIYACWRRCELAFKGCYRLGSRGDFWQGLIRLLNAAVSRNDGRAQSIASRLITLASGRASPASTLHPGRYIAFRRMRRPALIARGGRQPCCFDDLERHPLAHFQFERLC